MTFIVGPILQGNKSKSSWHVCFPGLSGCIEISGIGDGPYRNDQ